MTPRQEFRAYMKAANRTPDNNDSRHLSETQAIAYCRGEMSDAEYQVSQAHLEYCEQCIALFRNARDFLEPTRPEEEEVTGAETHEAWLALSRRLRVDPSTARSSEGNLVAGDFRHSTSKSFFRGSRFTFAMAACLLISFGALGFIGWRFLQERQARRQSQEVAGQLEGKQRELEQRLLQLEQSGSDQLNREREQRLAAEAERDHLQALLAVTHPDRSGIRVYPLTLSSERGAADELRLDLKKGTQFVRLKLLRSKPYEFHEYAIELVDPQGRVVREISKVRPASNDGTLSILLNCSNLQTGKYRLRLFSYEKVKQQLGEYGLSVTVER